MKRVFMYCRKSSEDKGKQILSIDDQKRELWRIAKNLNLKVIDEPIEEVKSAKAPGRPKFSELVKKIYNNEADGILCWKLDRLARNPIDGGNIIWIVKDQGKVIYTPSQTFSHQSENTIMMYIEFGMAQKYIDDLGKSAKRGMKTKAEMGWYPAHAPLGYENTPGEKKGSRKIISDNNFKLVQRCFYEILKGKQASHVWRKAREKWGLKSKKGNPVAHSTFYNILTHPFYYGEYEWPRGSGNWYQGKHEPMITKEQFDVVQKMLGKNGKPISRSHTFDLTGLFRCSIYSCAITATKKTKHYKTTGRIAEYTYYHCSKKNQNIKCSQPPVSEKDFENEIMKQLMMLRPPEEFVTWAKKWIKTVHDYESQTEEEILASQNKELESVENQLSNLLDLRIRSDIDDSTYRSKKTLLEQEKLTVKRKINESGNNLSSLRIRVENAIDIAYGSHLRFKTGKRETKQEILVSLGSNLILNHKKIRIDLLKHFEVFRDNEKWEDTYEDWLEPQKYMELFEKRPDLRPANPVWLPREDSNLQPTG